MALQALVKQERIEGANDLLEAIPKGVVSEVAFKTLEATLHLLQGLPDNASKYADEALAILDDEMTVFDTRRLALLLFSLRRFQDALPLWQRISNTSVLSSDTKHLLECASRLNRHEIMLDTFARLREAGVNDRTLLDSEISLLEMYDIDTAVRILDDEISRYPNDTELKLRRSILGLAFDRPDLVDHDPLSVPNAGDVAPLTALNAVQVLRAIGRELYAVQYAYEVLRRNFRNSDAHRAFVRALAPFPNEPQMEHPECVETGAAVCYVEKGDSVPHWIVVEDTEAPDSQLPERELSPENEICKAMMGKKVGDSFILASGIQDRFGTIIEIQNKYVYRFNDCLGQWQIRFPDLPYVQSVRLSQQTNESGTPEPDFSAILKSVDERHEFVSKVHKTYQENELPLHVIGKFFEATAFEAIQHLASAPDVPVRCCLGSDEENHHATKALRSSNTVVLDMSTISSLMLLGRLDILEGWSMDFVVSMSTVNELRQKIANESQTHGNESGVIIKTETGYQFVKSTAEQKAAYIRKLRHLVEVVESNCKIESCKSLAATSPEKRDTLVELFGLYGAETILLSAVPGAVLWTDDLVQSEIAKKEYGVSRIWTQFVIGMCVESGVVTPEAFLDASARLLGYGYYFTGNNPRIVRQAGAIAEWQVNGWPLSQALFAVGEESVDLTQVLQLVAGFLRLLYQESIPPQTRMSITLKILERIAKREGGIQGIKSLHNALPRIFGVNVIGLEDANQTIEAWLKGINAKPIGGGDLVLGASA